MDGGWDQRASGSAYNSDSGRHVSVGARTRKVVNLLYFSKRCCKCEKKQPHADELCANLKKYDKSSKAMEPIGSVDAVLKIWNEVPSAYVAAIVMDEDSTTRSKLSHSMKELVANKRMTEAKRRYKPDKPGNLGKKKGDHGILPLDHPAIEKLSDPIHYVKNYKSELYTLVKMGKGVSDTHQADAMRLSRNLAYMMAQNTRGTPDCTFEKFVTAGKASIEHHWNNHEHCGSWCQGKSWTPEEAKKKIGNYRNKVTHAKEYKQQLNVQAKFTSTERMRSVYHEHDNNKTENIHGIVTNQYLPKRSYFCQTICGKARTFLGVSIDSHGHEAYLNQLYQDLGIHMTAHTRTHFRQMDGRREKAKIYEKSDARKKVRSQKKLEKITKEWNKENKDKKTGDMYKPRMTAPKASSRKKKEKGDGANSKDGRPVPFCKTCKQYGHQRKTSKKCTGPPSTTCSTDQTAASGVQPEGTYVRLSILILQAGTSVLTCRMVCTYRESHSSSYRCCRTNGAQRTLRGFRIDPKTQDVNA